MGSFQLRIPGWGGSALDRTLSAIALLAVAAALGVLGHTVAKPPVVEQFTEFYVLDSYGVASDYPRRARVGTTAEAVVGIHNHEDRVVSYRLEVRIDGRANSEVGPVVLADEEKWEQAVAFTPDEAGENEKVEFLLYANGGPDPLLEPLRLWISVTE
jgi:uncharacterized membrane protein